MLEVFDTQADNGKEVSQCLFDIETTSFDFISEDAILVSDVQGNFTLAKGVLKQSSLRISIVQTKFPRIRQVKSSFSGLAGKEHYQYVASISTDMKIAFWSVQKLLALEGGDLLEEVKADKVIKSKHRLTCLAINNLNEMKVKKSQLLEAQAEEKLLGKKREREEEVSSEDESDDESGEEEGSSAVSDISLSDDEEGEIEFDEEEDEEEGEVDFEDSEDSAPEEPKKQAKLSALNAKEKALQKQLGALKKEFGGQKKKQRTK
uniref:Uncharacterized protein n=1 Tax=Strombidium inclinatum TaxID=197538 RepID=A0A7S3N0Z7_9SPIT|mmetsp:Transcript_36990/g.56682  ORF Transcript_36990/g.56682 Transcript_36990/m.56682 type:complete len:262 (+) Transcript_36990:793-1578(+)